MSNVKRSLAELVDEVRKCLADDEIGTFIISREGKPSVKLVITHTSVKGTYAIKQK